MGRIKELGDWRDKMLAGVRALIKEADPRCGGGVEVARRAGLGA